MFARTNSNRVKRKLFKSILGINLLKRSIDIAKSINFIDKIVLATTTNSSDNVIVKECQTHNIEYFRGSESNVLERFFKCIQSQEIVYDHAVRYCCDNYLCNQELIEENIKRIIDKKLDLVTPGEFSLCTKGTSQVVLSIECLKKIYEKAKKDVYLEHVENYCLENWKQFRIDYQIVQKKYYFKNLNFSLDTSKDFNFIEKNRIDSIHDKRLGYIDQNLKSSKTINSKKYFVDEGKYHFKTRIGYFYKKNFFKPEININIDKITNIELEKIFIKKNCLRYLFNCQFMDSLGHIYFPDIKNKKFKKINHSLKKCYSWNNYEIQKKRILCFREIQNI